ncbi:hypothetical protein KIPE111705_01695 [Kibdelosporangium persicum]|uniref:Condensation domain-containing protein n=1 Tax=Kibdelosporangium persicum TaxID=2698649 RepID=A0ABX2F7F6_9PSEU|nr:hypothetical protein [Kibdelosporangium persicum]NRN66890.1 hypothetical protein [Kibdelosporangium persicum]
MRVEVGRFTGADWEGPVTWAQHAQWDSIHRQDTSGWYRDCVAVLPVDDTLPEVLARISRAVGRYEGMRTQILPGPVQRLCGTGEYPVEIVEAGARHDFVVDEVSHQLRAADRFERGRQPFDFAVVTRNGTPRSVVMCVSNLAMDASAIGLLVQTGLAPQTDINPRDVLALQDGYRWRSDEAVAFWTAELAKVDAPFTGYRGGGGTLAAGLTSSANAARLARLAKRSTSRAVMLAVVAIALQAVHRGSLCLRLEVSNRHMPRLAEHVGILAQNTPLVVDVDRTRTFGHLVDEMWHGRMRSARHAMWSPVDLSAALDAAGLSQETFSVNDLRECGLRAEPRAPDPGRDYALHDLPGWPYQLGRCSIAFAGDATLLTLAVRVDTAYVPPGHVGRILRAMDSVLRNAAPDIRVAELVDAIEPAAA